MIWKKPQKKMKQKYKNTKKATPADYNQQKTEYQT
jgi:hypothetical protein